MRKRPVPAAAGASIPDRAYFKIGQAAAVVGVPTSTLRYWESEIPHLRPGRSPAGHRVYSRVQVLRLVELRQAIEGRGLTLEGARRALAGRDPAGAADKIGRVRAEAEALLLLAAEPED